MSGFTRLPLGLLIIMFVVILLLIWLPRFAASSLGLDQAGLPVNVEILDQLSVIASIGALLLFALVLWIRKKSRGPK